MDAKQSIGWDCGKCGKSYTSREMAEQCCRPYSCNDCGAETPRYRTICDPCAEKRRVRKATEITEADTDWICDPHCRGYQDGYFPSTEALQDWVDDQGDWVNEKGECVLWGTEGAVWRPGDEMPAYVYACTSETPQIDIEHVLESVLEDHHEGAGEQLVDELALMEFVREWNAKQTTTSYYVDYSRVIVLNREAFEKIKAQPEAAQ